MDLILDVIRSMRSNRIPNYIAPGLESHLIGREDCKVRLFEQTRHQDFFISPHNHRFDFVCYVLKGHVYNHLYRHANIAEPQTGWYQISKYIPEPGFGTKNYRTEVRGTGLFIRETTEYFTDQWYGMTKNEFHSIEFVHGSVVLFFEGANQESHSYFLEPIIGGRAIPTFKVEDWMYHE